MTKAVLEKGLKRKRLFLEFNLITLAFFIITMSALYYAYNLNIFSTQLCEGFCDASCGNCFNGLFHYQAGICTCDCPIEIYVNGELFLNYPTILFGEESNGSKRSSQLFENCEKVIR